MPWKLLAFIAVMAVVLVFVGFNLDNRCDISIVFVTFRSVPVVITILATYVLGLLSAFVLALGRAGKANKLIPGPKTRKKRDTATTQPDAQSVEQASAAEGTPAKRP